MVPFAVRVISVYDLGLTPPLLTYDSHISLALSRVLQTRPSNERSSPEPPNHLLTLRPYIRVSHFLLFQPLIAYTIPLHLPPFFATHHNDFFQFPQFHPCLYSSSPVSVVLIANSTCALYPSLHLVIPPLQSIALPTARFALLQLTPSPALPTDHDRNRVAPEFATFCSRALCGCGQQRPLCRPFGPDRHLQFFDSI